MKKYMLIVALAAMVVLGDGQVASAGRRGGRGGCGGGGCGGGGCGGGGYHGGGHGGYMGCSTCGGGHGGYAMGGGAGTYVAGGSTCVGGMCSIAGGTAVVQGGQAQASLVVNLPADATLTIDDEATTSTSGNRVFVTPPLESGKEFHYTLKARVVRDGKVQTTTRQVAVRAGEVSSVELTVPATTGAAQ
jgi:uncharacterized protein (TIGR03000 family)